MDIIPTVQQDIIMYATTSLFTVWKLNLCFWTLSLAGQSTESMSTAAGMLYKTDDTVVRKKTDRTNGLIDHLAAVGINLSVTHT